MGYVGCDALMNYESEARSGRPDALYSLGLAYSTGQGVGVDYIAAHKWFNLAAMKGVDEARTWRAPVSPENSAAQNAGAQGPAPQRPVARWRDWALFLAPGLGLVPGPGGETHQPRPAVASKQ